MVFWLEREPIIYLRKKINDMYNDPQLRLDLTAQLHKFSEEFYPSSQ